MIVRNGSQIKQTLGFVADELDENALLRGSIEGIACRGMQTALEAVSKLDGVGGMSRSPSTLPEAATAAGACTGQAAEFDYSGTQAVRARREEGYRVILVNSNPATITMDPDLADATYVEPITP